MPVLDYNQISPSYYNYYSTSVQQISGGNMYLRWIPGNEIPYVFLDTVSTERQMSIYKAT